MSRAQLNRLTLREFIQWSICPQKQAILLLFRFHEVLIPGPAVWWFCVERASRRKSHLWSPEPPPAGSAWAAGLWGPGGRQARREAPLGDSQTHPDTPVAGDSLAPKKHTHKKYQYKFWTRVVKRWKFLIKVYRMFCKCPRKLDLGILEQIDRDYNVHTHQCITNISRSSQRIKNVWLWVLLSAYTLLEHRCYLDLALTLADWKA